MSTRRITGHITLLAATCLIVGCSTYSLKELRHTTPKGSEFQKSLSRLYMEYAIEEEKNYDWFTSMHFADKGLLAAYGNDVDPEKPEEWDVPDEVLPSMRRARDALVSVLNSSARSTYPHVAARAQYYFDCWVEQQEENWQEHDIDTCRNGLADMFERLGVTGIELIPMVDPEATMPVAPEKEEAPARIELPTMQDRVGKDDGDDAGPTAGVGALEGAAPGTTVGERIERAAAQRTAPPPVSSEVPQGVTTSSYMVFFDDLRTGLPEEGKKIIDEVIKSLSGTADYSVVIGANEHVEFAEKRAESVKERLVQGGIDGESITVSVAQVPDFMADSGEGDSAPIRHRVEIYLNQ